jgi:glutaminyl-peptide cyclotransferase
MRRAQPRFLALLLAALPAVAAASDPPPVFDGQRAHDLVRKQCAFGPRNPGSAGHAKCLVFLESELRAAGAAVQRQPFTYTLPGGKPLAMTNLIARWQPENPNRILLCAHWDTRPWADLDPDSTRRDEPILGANDGASGVAVLLELARHLEAHPPLRGVDIVLFDGEDLGTEAHREGFFRGAREYGRSVMGRRPPERAILLDMVGDADLLFPMEGNSARAVPGTVAWFWKAAKEVAPAYFADQIGPFVEDDHLPLIAAGIPCMNLIDFDYPYWHTHADTPDKVSPGSLQVVGDVLVHILYTRP